MTIWSAASSVTSCPALLSSSGSSRTQEKKQKPQKQQQQEHQQQKQSSQSTRRSSKRLAPKSKVRDLVESSTDEFSSRENLSKTPTLRPPKRYVPRYVANNGSPLSITSRNTVNSNGVSSNSNLSTLSKGSSFVTAESDCLSRRAAMKKGKERNKSEAEAKQIIKRTGSNGSNLSKSTAGLLILPRMSIESMTTNEMLHLAEEQTAVSDKSPWNNAQTVLDGLADSPRRVQRTASLQAVKNVKTQETRKIQFGKNILQFRPPSRADNGRSSEHSKSHAAMSCTSGGGAQMDRHSTSSLNTVNNNQPKDNIKQAESVILTVLQILYFYGTFFLGFGLLLVAYYLHD